MDVLIRNRFNQVSCASCLILNGKFSCLERLKHTTRVQHRPHATIKQHKTAFITNNTGPDQCNAIKVNYKTRIIENIYSFG